MKMITAEAYLALNDDERVSARDEANRAADKANSASARLHTLEAVRLLQEEIRTAAYILMSVGVSSYDTDNAVVSILLVEDSDRTELWKEHGDDELEKDSEICDLLAQAVERDRGFFNVVEGAVGFPSATNELRFEDLLGGADALHWEGAGTDESGDQNAESEHVYPGNTSSYYSLGPNLTGWAVERIQIRHGEEVRSDHFGQYDTEDEAKRAAQREEDAGCSAH